jgi:hypothetical protein
LQFTISSEFLHDRVVEWVRMGASVKMQARNPAGAMFLLLAGG